MHLNVKLKTAILIFANSSHEESRHKSIAQDGALFDALTAATVKTVEKSKLPYFHYTEKHQSGFTFGERFSNAIQAVFDQGYEHVITIGNDSPQLKASHLLEAYSQLQSKKFVLGPTIDGGFYLMGLHKSQFKASSFKNLDWQTSRLANQLYRLVSKQATKIVLLQRLFDIDTVQDIKLILTYSHQLDGKLLLLLLKTVNYQKLYKYFFSQIFNTDYFTKRHNKGSPILLQC